jgi:hypothetical protein
MKLEFKFGKEFEFNQVKNIISNLNWYVSEGYEVRLPKGISKNSSDEEILKSILLEFDENKYIRFANNLSQDFSKVNNEFIKSLKNIFGFAPREIIVYLTNYGAVGGYSLPNEIVLNINSNEGIKIFFHETIHLFIEEQIKRYNVLHWEKERIVDLILNSSRFNFLNYNMQQRGYGGCENYIDGLFNKYFFEDIERFFLKIKGARIYNNQKE